MYSYFCYGLSIGSTLRLSELTPADGNTHDIVIRLGKTGREIPETDHTGCFFQGDAHETYLFWEQVGGFLVRNGNEIIAEPLPGTEEKMVRLPLLGAVLSVAIHQRGLIGLHASAVAMNGHAVAFLGPSGFGKSTMAAALYSRGHAVLADDLVVLDPEGEGDVKLLPGFPLLKLFPESIAASLGDNPDHFPTLMPGLDKRGRVASNGFTTDAVPIKTLYILSYSSVFSIEPVSAREKIPNLIRWGYGARTFKNWLTGPVASTHLQTCAAIANKVDLQLLKRPRDFEALPELARKLEELLAKS